jgi:stage III sporulation protein AB
MVKILGMFAVLISSVITGLLMANNLSERIKALKDIYQCATHIKTELEYRAADICECFKRRGTLFSRAHSYIVNDGLLPSEALKKAAEEQELLNKNDKEIIFQFAENLNKEDVDGQIANTALFLENIKARIKDAEGEYLMKNRLYKSGGAIVGIGLIILLL